MSSWGSLKWAPTNVAVLTGCGSFRGSVYSVDIGGEKRALEADSTLDSDVASMTSDPLGCEPGTTALLWKSLGLPV